MLCLHNVRFFSRIPIVKVDASAILGKRRKRQSGDEFNMFEDDFGDDFEIFDPSVAFYPNPYCRIVEGKLLSLNKNPRRINKKVRFQH